jgi:hypothetical protein
MPPELKILFRQNPNIQIRNPKKTQISNAKMTQATLIIDLGDLTEKLNN